MTSTVPDENSAPASSSLIPVLAATGIAGISGFLIQLLAPSMLPEDSRFIAFSVFWSALYLIGAALSGVQQEIARATRPADPALDPGAPARARAALGRYCLVVIGVVVVSAVVIGIVLAGSSFVSAPLILTATLLVGAIGYLGLVVLMGLYYGLSRLRDVAVIVGLDAILRTIATPLAFLAHGSTVVVALSIALPLPIAVGFMWLRTRHRLHGAFRFDVDLRRLLTHTLGTTAAAVATGLMVAGMPLVLEVTLRGTDETVLSGLIMVLLLTRAPLVVPIMALQSWLIVRFRGNTGRMRAELFRYLAVLSAVGLVASVAAGLWSPWLVNFVSGGRYHVSSFVSVVAIVSATLLAMMGVAGAALLAESRHGGYLAGWAIASLGMIALLVVPLPLETRLALALVVPSVLGLGVQLWLAVRHTDDAAGSGREGEGQRSSA